MNPIRLLFTLLVFAFAIAACAVQATPSAPVSAPVERTPQPGGGQTPATVEPAIAVDVQDPANPAATSTPTETLAQPTPRPTLVPEAWKELPVIPTVSDTARAIYQRGLAMGTNPQAFSKVGDCQNVSSYFLSAFDTPGEYSLGTEYAYLQDTITYYQGSFSRESEATKGGYNVAAILQPLRADPKACNPDESPLTCELRIHNPSVVIVSLEEGWGSRPAETYGRYMRQVIETIIARGVVPILATKADNIEGDHSINATIAQIAYEYDIPLWNFWLAVQPLPDHGLSKDGFHLTFARNFFDDPVRMKNAWPVRNLTALQALDAVRRGLTQTTP
ncbi:MAG: hypothetical protein WHV44_02300 [Anaerolineales bacterium]